MRVATIPVPAAAAAARTALNKAARASLRSVRLVVWVMISPCLMSAGYGGCGEIDLGR